LRTEADEIAQQQEGSDTVQYDQKGHASACVSITLPFQEKGIDADDIDFFSMVGWGLYCHYGPPALAKPL
jgi:hypothetical protein